jgi:putative FmdB family regulatory protein
MPTYEYRCANGHVFDKRQKISDRPVARCPECGAPATRQISGGAGLVFKGSGFYITDYGKDGKGPARPPAEKATSDKPAKSESSSPATPAKDSSGKPEK